MHPHPTLLPTEVSSSYRYLTVPHPIYLIMSNRPLLPQHKIQTTSLTTQNTCCDNKILTFLFTTRVCSSDTIYYHSPNTPSPLVSQHLSVLCPLPSQRSRRHRHDLHESAAEDVYAPPSPTSASSFLCLPAWLPGFERRRPLSSWSQPGSQGGRPASAWEHMAPGTTRTRD